MSSQNFFLIFQRVTFGRFNVNCNGENALKTVIADPLKHIFLPFFQKGNDFNRDKLDGAKNKKACIHSFNHFLTYIEGN